jgi:hypothetical protein
MSELVRCFNCDAPALPEDNFCPNCGARLAAGTVKDLGAADRPEWQRVAAPPPMPHTPPGGLPPDQLAHHIPPQPAPGAPQVPPSAPAPHQPVDTLPPPPSYYDRAAYSDYSVHDQQRFLSSFSWGPGCGIYFWSRAMLWFLLGQVLLNLWSRSLEWQEQGMAAGDAAGQLGIGVQGLLVVAGFAVLLVWAGRVGRRRRWEMLNWRDFDHFKRDEQSWHIAGVAGWILIGLAVIVGFFIGLSGAG